MISQILLPIAGTLLCYLVFHVSQILYRNLASPLRHVAGPKTPDFMAFGFIFGNFKDMMEDPYLTAKWRREFGSTFRFKGLFSISELHTADIKAVNHIVTRADIYQKTPSALNSAQNLLGKGILSVELEEHKRHRRALNPAFGIAQIRILTEIFVEKADLLREVWARQVAEQNGEARIEVLSWLRRMTLDVIGQAGFNYQFDALEAKGQPNELNQVFTELFHSPHANRIAGFRLAQGIAPILRLMPGPGWKVLLAARNKMYSIGKRIVSKSKADIKASKGEKTLGARRDLLSILLKANLSTAIPETQRLNEAEVIAQIPTFFVAGHETTSSSTAWALHALSENTAVQSKLREELLTLSTDNPTMDELNSLPYLEHVVRETMRVHAPVVFTQRMAMEEDALPLSTPYIDKEGKAHHSLPIPKGQMIHIPILAINTDKELWGEDAAEFKPERWEKLPDSVGAIPGVWANLLTFFAGPHNCIGFRFSLAEMKALLFVLIRSFEFEQAVPKGGIGPINTGLMQRPAVLAEGKGSGLPLIVKPYEMQF
ncbi:cytochrome P450 [Mycena albidolilacea]|uniref:Cytochrome P450 n=1 Tax=Mycena albidolilacea TaxID=1033008 RepID=A0AAD7EQH4_9AGAR|nr:cytochrome P450 [Mycena albidolilacea]